MNRRLHYFNLLGVVLLAGLCGWQWRQNRALNLQGLQNEKVRADQSVRLEEQARTVRNQAADLDDFRGKLAHLAILLKETGTNLAAATRQADQLEKERDQLKESVTNWAAAVTLRDQQLKETVEQLKTLAGERQATVTQFNELAGRYNAVVQDLNEARARLGGKAASPTNRPPSP